MIDPPSHRLNLKLISAIYFAKLGLQISRIICAKSRESLRYSNDAGVSVTSQRRLVINNSYVSNLRSNSPFGRISRYFLCRRVASPRVALRGTREQNEKQGETRVKYCRSVRYCRKVWLFRASIRNHENGSKSPAQCLTSHPQETYPASRCMASVRSPETEKR